MIFQTRGAIEKIVRGEKTQTRRIKAPGEQCLWRPPEAKIILVEHGPGDIQHVYRKGGNILRFQVEKSYAVQPGRGKASVWVHWDHPCDGIHIWDDLKSGEERIATGQGYQQLRIQITDIRDEDVRKISDADVVAEGYDSHENFLRAWCRMHDKNLWFDEYEDGFILHTPDHRYGRFKTNRYGVFEAIDKRPAKYYQAWALTFKVVKDG